MEVLLPMNTMMATAIRKTQILPPSNREQLKNLLIPAVPSGFWLPKGYIPEGSTNVTFTQNLQLAPGVFVKATMTGEPAPAAAPTVNDMVLLPMASQTVSAPGAEATIVPTSIKKKQKRGGRTTNYNLQQRAASREKPKEVQAMSQNLPAIPQQSAFNNTSQLQVASILEQQKFFCNFLNAHLIYFRVLNEKIHEHLKGSALQHSQSSLQDLNLLKEDLRIFLSKLEKFYHEESVFIWEIKDNLQFKDILKYTAKLQIILDRLDESEISKLLHTTIPNSEEHVLCSILGLQNVVAEFLKSRSPDMRGHQTDEQWILDYIEAKDKEVREVKDCANDFEFLGFSVVKAEALKKLVERNPYANHQTPAEWARDHIEQEFKYNILLAVQTQGSHTEPYNSTGNYDEDFDVPTDDAEDDAVVKAQDTFMLTLEEVHQRPAWLEDYLAEEQNSIQGAKFWFHGTDHKSALNIIKSGIDVEASKRGRDFSDGKGFYLSTNYEVAHIWPTQRTKGTNTAVLVFRATPELFKATEGITFEEDNDEWRSVVSFFRKGKMGPDAQKKKMYKKLKFIFGPMSGDGFKV